MAHISLAHMTGNTAGYYIQNECFKQITFNHKIAKKTQILMYSLNKLYPSRHTSQR